MTVNKIFNFLRKTAFFSTLLMFSYILMVIKNDADPDLWHRMSVGKIFSQLGRVTYNDIFSYLPKKEMWIDHEWLSGVIFYYLGNVFGDYGLIVLQVLITFLILFLIYKTNQLISPENKLRISYYLVVLIGFHAGLSSTLRCQSFTYLFFTLWVYLLEKIRRGETGLIWIFPVTMLLWANLHGGFLAGFGLIVFYIIGELLNRQNISKYLMILGLSIPVTLINPYGIKYWSYILHATTMNRPYITEWEAFNPLESFYAGLGFKVLILFLLAGYGYRMFKKQFNIDKVEFVAIFVTFYLAMKHERHSVFFAIIAACYGYRHFIAFLEATIGKTEQKISGLFRRETLEKMLFAREYGVYFFLIITSVYIICSTPVVVNLEGYPVKAIEFIRKNNISGNLFVPFNWGSYAMWKLYPQNYVSIDGRFEETYETRSYLDVVDFTLFNKNQDEILNKYHHDIFLLEADTDAYNKLKTNPDWEIVYKSELAAVFLRLSNAQGSFQLPEDNPGYYIKTKYENNIKF